MNQLKFYPWKRTVIKTVALIIVLMIISAVVNHPVLNNELAMTQMENSDELFIAWDTYNRIQSALPVVYSIIALCYGFSIGIDVRNYIKRKEMKGDLK